MTTTDWPTLADLTAAFAAAYPEARIEERAVEAERVLECLHLNRPQPVDWPTSDAILEGLRELWPHLQVGPQDAARLAAWLRVNQPSEVEAPLVAADGPDFQMDGFTNLDAEPVVEQRSSLIGLQPNYVVAECAYCNATGSHREGDVGSGRIAPLKCPSCGGVGLHVLTPTTPKRGLLG